jgi:HAD superfamily hydrolase (TIGR01509 family)
MAEFKAVIFDMDGTLVDAKLWHYEALNEALSIFGMEISREDHLTRFEGLPTRKKLEALTAEKGLPPRLYPIINEIKQERTTRLIAKECFPRLEQLLLFQWLKSQGLKLAVATNSIRSTAEKMLDYAGVLPFLDVFVTNEDISEPKPNPEIYHHTCKKLAELPRDCVVIEDNHYGIDSAREAGCHVVEVEAVEEVRISLLERFLRPDGATR